MRILLLRIATGLTALVWVGGLIVFIVLPLLPSIPEIRTAARRSSPRELSYLFTTQLLVSITAPDYSVDDAGVGNITAGPGSSIEQFDADGVVVADLEARGAVLKIPSIGVEGRIVDGLSQDAMMRGFWHHPLSTVPGKRGNTVIFGHRFQNLPPDPATFFNLDQVKVGDKVHIELDGREIQYTVVGTKTVEKLDDSVISHSGEYRLTLITCTPLWTAEKRLAIIAIQDKVEQVI